MTTGLLITEMTLLDQRRKRGGKIAMTTGLLVTETTPLDQRRKQEQALKPPQNLTSHQRITTILMTSWNYNHPQRHRNWQFPQPKMAHPQQPLMNLWIF